ncbi:hypothetical protein L6164_010285 [Bauhinia variegata]|uniref:Uncharacterized protein n=1 Tax=Bauhinia variegata TaxID=167791 RepID=A0ACB9PMF8_BAUVA|nr:hypothetical protein L6164_010285 [Bauhinia variegata]
MGFGFKDLGISGNGNSSGELSDVQVGTFESRKLVNDLLTSESAEGFGHLDAMVSPKSYSRENTRRFSLPRTSDESSGNVTGPSVSPLDDLKFGKDLETSSSKVQSPADRITSPCVEGSGKENDFIQGGESISSLPQEAQGLKLTSFNNEPPETGGVNKPKTSSKSVCSWSAERDNAHQDSAQTSVKNGLSESKINGKPDKAGFGMGESCHDGNEIQLQNEKKDFRCSSPSNNKFRNEESSGLPNMNLCNKESTSLCKKSPRKKTLAKKSLGSRPKLRAATKQKGPVCLNKTTPQGDGVMFSSGCQEKATGNAEKLPMSSRIVDVEISLELENASNSAEKASCRNDFMDDETDTLEDKFEYEVGMAPNEKKSELVHFSKKVDKRTEQRSEAIYHTTK